MKAPSSFPYAGVCLLLTMFIGSPCVMAQSVPYSTAFEAPLYSLGAIDGQDGWIGDGNVQNATSQYIRSGTQSLSVTANSQASHYFTDVPAGPLFIDGYFHEPAVDTIPDATSLGDGTSFVLFHKTQGIMAFDGDGDGGGTWIATGIEVATNTLQRVTIAQDYDLKTWNLYIDEQPVSYQGETPFDFGFRNDTIVSFCGVDVEAGDTGTGYLDDFTISYTWPDFLLQETPPDTIVYSFLQEWYFNESEMGDDTGFTWDLAPGEGDAQKVDAFDLLDLLGSFSPVLNKIKDTDK